MGGMAAVDSTQKPTPVGDAGFRKWPAFIAIAVGIFLTVAEQTAVAIALPEIADEFKVNIPAVQWVTLGYVLSTSAAFMPVGRLSDIVGRPKVYTIGFVGFIGTAVLAGLSTAFWILVVAKVVQGLASAGIQANAMAIVTEAFPKRERGRAIGLYTTTVGSGAATGPFLGGLLVGEFGWRWLFYASVPLGIVAIGAAVWALRGWPSHSEPGEERGRFDWVGAATSSSTLVILLLSLSNSHRFGWGSGPIVAGLAGAAGLFCFFVWWELRNPHPMIDLRYFASRYFSLGVGIRFLLFLASAPRVILMPFYLIQVLGYAPHMAGLITAAASIAMALFGAVSGILSERLGPRWLMLAGIMIAASAMFTFSTLDVDSSPIHAVIALALSGAGMGTFYSPNTSDILNSRSGRTYGITAALLNLTRTTGNVTGIAVSTTVIAVYMAAAGYEPSLSAVTGSGGEGVKNAFVSGLSTAFLVSGSLLGLAFVLSIVQGRVGRREVGAEDRAPATT